MAIHMVNCSIMYPHGIIKDLLVKVERFVFLVEFVVLDMKEEEDLPIILGIPFLSTARVLVDIYNSKHTLWVRDEEITFGVKKEAVNEEFNDDVFCFEEVDLDKEENNDRLELLNLMEEGLVN